MNATATTTPRPLGFMAAPTIAAHLTGPLADHARRVREACDRTAAASARLFALRQPEQDSKAADLDAAAVREAASAEVWSDPGHPHADQLKADRDAALAELVARAGLSDEMVRAWVRDLRRSVDDVVAVDEAHVDKARAKIITALERTRPALESADALARRAAWLRHVAAEGLDAPGVPKRLSPEHMPAPSTTLAALLDQLLAAVAAQR